MAKKPVCLVCQKEMEPGFTIDRSGPLQLDLIPRWYPGEPRELFGSVMKPENKGCMIIAYRCPECEALRLYAPSTDPSSK